MNNDIMKFDFGDKNIRVFGTADDPLFVAKDVCECLGLKNHRQVLSALDEDEKDDVHIMDSIGRPQKTSVLTEPGLYSLMNKSIKPEAKKFQRWVYHDVIPSIRKNGIYSIEQKVSDDLLLKRQLVEGMLYLSGEVSQLKNSVSSNGEDIGIIKSEVASISMKIDSIEKRKELTLKTQRMHIKTIITFFNCMCARCGIVRVVDESGNKTKQANFDHWVSKSVAKPDSTWLVCKECNQSFNDQYFKSEARKYFEVYQERLRIATRSKQLTLPGCKDLK